MGIVETHQILINALKEVLNGDILSKSKKSFIDSKEASEFLGISISTVYKYTFYNIVPHYKTGKKLYFKKEELENWLNQRKIKSNDELAKEIEKKSNYSKRK